MPQWEWPQKGPARLTPQPKRLTTDDTDVTDGQNKDPLRQAGAESALSYQLKSRPGAKAVFGLVFIRLLRVLADC